MKVYILFGVEHSGHAGVEFTETRVLGVYPSVTEVEQARQDRFREAPSDFCVWAEFEMGQRCDFSFEHSGDDGL